MHFYILAIIFYINFVFSSFSPDTTDYDAYGVKIAANEVLFVQAEGSAKTFLVQFAPYDSMDSLQCSFDYDNSDHYVYSVGVGPKQNSTSNVYFYIAGEIVSTTSISTTNRSYIGIWINRDPHNVSYYLNTHQPLSCDHFQVEQMKFLSAYDHQEYYVIAVEPYGTYAIGLAEDFVFTYRPFPSGSMTIKSSSTVWPDNSTFYPCAADASDTFTIIAGFVKGAARSRVRATPTVYLMWNSNLTVLSTWSYSATTSSWQSRLTYSFTDSWSSKYTMSVKINSDDPTRVLVGMPFLNTVFLFRIQNGNKNFTLISSRENGHAVGFGKSVTWLTQSQAAILVPSYSTDYLTWYSTKVYIYTSFNDTTFPSSPTAVIPNSQQPIPSTINSKLIRMVSTPNSVAVLDTNGGVVIILNEDAGYYPSTDITDSPVAAAMPVVSHGTECIAGTYKSEAGIHPCTLCPIGTKNTATTAATVCSNCLSDSFCPLGAYEELSTSLLTSLSQAYAYPSSPEMDNFEDILLNNMFAIGSTPHCVVVSPIFWTLMLVLIFVLLLVGMGSMNLCVQPSKREQWRSRIKSIFQRTDLVGEGELWIGGLASIAVLLVSGMAYGFAISYLNQYPSESVEGSAFMCDQTLRNAKFESSLQALAVPVSDTEQTIFSLLNNQVFTLQIDFLNTNASCRSVSISEITDSSTASLTMLPCMDDDGILATKVILTQHTIKIQVTIDETALIGAIRVGLTGPSQSQSLNKLQELNFLQVFYSPSSLTLAQSVSIDMAITKVVNETESLSGGDSEYSGIWYPTFTYSLTEMFMTANTYVSSANSTSTTLTIDITETSYYIKNVQSPIAKQAEIIFRTLLFAFLCLELCAMAFLICKLLIIPLYNRIYACYSGTPLNTVEPEHHDHEKSHHP